MTVEVVKRDILGPNLTRIEVRVANRGYLGTYGISSAKKLPHVEPLRLTAECEGGVQLGAPTTPVTEIGHLDGWGQGLYNGPTIFAPWTRGSVHEKHVTLVAEGKGRLVVKVGSCRVGYRKLPIDVG